SVPASQGLLEIQLCECECIRLRRISSKLRSRLHSHEPRKAGFAEIAGGLVQQRQHVEPDRGRRQTRQVMRKIKDILAPDVLVETLRSGSAVQSYRQIQRLD